MRRRINNAEKGRNHVASLVKLQDEGTVPSLSSSACEGRECVSRAASLSLSLPGACIQCPSVSFSLPAEHSILSGGRWEIRCSALHPLPSERTTMWSPFMMATNGEGDTQSIEVQGFAASHPTVEFGKRSAESPVTPVSFLDPKQKISTAATIFDGSPFSRSPENSDSGTMNRVKRSF